MSDINNQDIDEAASEWFVLMSVGDPSPQEKTEFENWLRISPDHKRAYEAFENIWGTMDQLSAHEYAAPEQANTKETEPAIYQSTNHVSWFKKLSLRIYSVAGLACTIAITLFFFISPNASREYGHHATEIAEIQTIVLPDNSTIQLGAQSNIRYEFDKHSRSIFLSNGQAYFAVKKRYNKNGHLVPFRVYIGESFVEVLGTEFDINMRSSGANITVIEGSVSVQSNFDSTAKFTLKPGQQIIAVGAKYEKLNKPTNVNTDIMTSWRQGRLTYRNAELQDVVEDINRFYQGEFILDQNELKGVRVTTSFNLDQIHEMTKMLENILPVKVRALENNKYFIEAADQLDNKNI